MQRRRPAPGATRRKTADDHDFLPTGNVFGSPRQLRNAASFCPRCPCSQSSPSISFSFFSLFFHLFSHSIVNEANVRNSHFLGDPRAKTVLNWSSRNPEVQFCFPVCSKALKTLLYKEPITFDDLKIVREISGQHVRNILEVDNQDSTVGGQRAQNSLSESCRNLLTLILRIVDESLKTTSTRIAV